MTGMGLADPDELDVASRRALEIAADTLLVDWLADVCRTGANEILGADSAMTEALPPKHRLRYTRHVARDFLGALQVVLHRLADQANETPVCGNTAQELAFRAMIYWTLPAPG